MKNLLTLIVSIISLLFVSSAIAGPVKIGMITTLSTTAGYLGEEIRDGFVLAIEQEDGKLGGVAVELLTDDDGRKPEKGKLIADKYMKKDKVRIMTGIVFSNVAMAVVPKVVRKDVVYVAANAGPSALAGKNCHENYFSVSYQNDNQHEALGEYLNTEGFKKVFILAPNYPAGKDGLAGFKRFYKGKIAAEVYTRLGQADYAPELANIRAAKPDAVYFFLPGGMGINFIKQYSQAGLGNKIPLFGPAFSFDERLLGAVGKAALGVVNGSQWTHDLQNPANIQFVEAFRKKYKRTPTLYASQGYDAARLIGSGLAAVKGDLSSEANMKAFKAALQKARFDSVRGKFKFGNNRHPIQDFYVRKVVTAKNGKTTNKTLKKVFSDHVDAYAGLCK